VTKSKIVDKTEQRTPQEPINEINPRQSTEKLGFGFNFDDG
jgi:hypothetical protein